MKKGTKTRQRDEADRLFSLYIRQRDEHCVACGSNDYLQCAHVISRSYKAIRWDETNAVCLCRACHVRYTHRPLEWQDWCVKYGIHYAELRHLALNGTVPDLGEVIAHLKTKVAA